MSYLFKFFHETREIILLKHVLDERGGVERGFQIPFCDLELKTQTDSSVNLKI